MKRLQKCNTPIEWFMKLTERAKAKEFKELTEEEVETIENKYQEIFQPTDKDFPD